MDFGQTNVEVGQKMANGQLLFLALVRIKHTYKNYNISRDDSEQGHN